MKKEIKPCECGANRWKTVKKNNKYQRKKC